MQPNPYEPPMSEAAAAIRPLRSAGWVLAAGLAGMVAGSFVSFMTAVVVILMWPGGIHEIYPTAADDIRLAALGFGSVGGWAIGLASGVWSMMRTRHHR